MGGRAASERERMGKRTILLRKTKGRLYLPLSLEKKGRLSLPGHRSKLQQRVLHPATKKGLRAVLVNYMFMLEHSLTSSIANAKIFSYM
jgi:hypothetical protein